MTYTDEGYKHSAHVTKVLLLAKHAEHCALKLIQFNSLFLRANSTATGAILHNQTNKSERNNTEMYNKYRHIRYSTAQ
jgi:hypothetical protein